MTITVKVVRSAKVWAAFAKIPDRVAADVGAQLDTETQNLVAAMKQTAPVSKLTENPGELRDSIKAYDNPNRPLSKRIIASAKDPKGRYIGQWVENGHTAPDGKTHVPGRPFFFPTYRALKKGMKKRLRAAGRKAIKAFNAENSSGG